VAAAGFLLPATTLAVCCSSIGKFIFQFRWLVVLGWILAAGTLALVVPAGDTTLGEDTDLLPANSPVHQALDQLAKHFGEKSALSSAVVIFEKRDAPLNSDDLVDIEKFAREDSQLRAGENIGNELNSTAIRTPATFALAGKANPLISDDGHAALVLVNLPYNFVTKSTARIVKHMQDVLADHPMPPGVTAAITGSAGYGYDYSVATEKSHQKTTVVTLISVIVILLLVYRAPIAALVPLTAIGIANVATFKLLASLAGLGIHLGSAEKIFTFVLLYGAGVDYSLLFMSRYREYLDDGKASTESIQSALAASIPAIASSAAMTCSGLVMLCFARFSVFRDSGPAVVVAIAIAAFAASTLVPAILAIVGPVVFWPNRPAAVARRRDPKVWPVIARMVAARPGWLMIGALVLLGIPAIKGARTRWNYDALFSLKPTYQARQGTEMVERHWPTGEIAPVTVLAVSQHPLTDAQWSDISAKMLAAVKAVPDVENVRSFSQPLGLRASAAQNSGASLLARKQVHSEYVSPDQQAMRMSVVLGISPLSRSAMEDASAIESAAAGACPGCSVHLTGATAEMIDLRDTTQRDFRQVATMALLAILLVVTIVLRDFPVAVFILAATALTYLTTLGLTCWEFEMFGIQGLEWKVQMLLFIVLIAVGQDYSIFFAVRLAQEARTLPCREATKRALIFTGPVISSCGLIMAATLGSVMAGDVTVLVQLGFAFALGMLIDTFIVRPLLLPSLILLSGRTLQKAVVGKPHRETTPDPIAANTDKQDFAKA
jgi:RND superfamily putative drug exporter